MFENKMGVIGVVIALSAIGTLVWQSEDGEADKVQNGQTEILNISENAEIDTDEMTSSIEPNANINNESLSYKKASARYPMNNKGGSITPSLAKIVEQSDDNRLEGQVDEIGGYFDANAIAPEDEVPQNNYIDSIGYYDPGAEAPSEMNSPLAEQSVSIAIETDEEGLAPEDDH
jgi:hypothetical protein